MVGYSYAADSHPDLSPAEYEAILPSNQALFPRSDQSDSAPKYTLSSWIPQVGLLYLLPPPFTEFPRQGRPQGQRGKCSRRAGSHITEKEGERGVNRLWVACAELQSYRRPAKPVRPPWGQVVFVVFVL